MEKVLIFVSYPFSNKKVYGGKTKFIFDCLQHGSRLPKKILGNNEKKDISVTETMGDYIGEIQR